MTVFWKREGTQELQLWGQTDLSSNSDSVMALVSYLTSGNQFPHLQSGDKNSTYTSQNCREILMRASIVPALSLALKIGLPLLVVICWVTLGYHKLSWTKVKLIQRRVKH